MFFLGLQYSPNFGNTDASHGNFALHVVGILKISDKV